MGDGTKENPFTREDVCREIDKCRSKGEVPNFSNKEFEEGIDLRGFDLREVIFRDARFPTHFEGDQLVKAKFDGSNLNVADLRKVNLQYAQFGMLGKQPTRLEGADLGGTILLNANFQGADLTAAQFQGKPIIPSDPSQAAQFQGKLWEILPASLEETDFRDANLFLANFKGCYFYGTKLEGAFIRGADILEAHLDEADWGSYIIGEESKKEELHFAESIYRRLKLWYQEHGMYDIAAKFYYREKEAARKALRWRSKSSSRHRLALELSRIFFGYGEEWKRIFIWITVVIFGLATVYYSWGSFSSSSFSDILYYSAASFTALGYGQWAPQPTGWAKGMGAAEAVIGVFLMALLLVTFVRKWTR